MLIQIHIPREASIWSSRDKGKGCISSELPFQFTESHKLNESLKVLIEFRREGTTYTDIMDEYGVCKLKGDNECICCRGNWQNHGT